LGLTVWGLWSGALKVYSLEFTVCGLQFGVYSLSLWSGALKVYSLGFTVWGLQFGVYGLGFTVWG